MTTVQWLQSRCSAGSQSDYSRVALQGVSRKLTIRVGVSISHAPCLSCHVDLSDTISCWNCCMLTLYCLIAHSIVISRRWETQALATSKRAANVPLWNRNLRRTVPPRRLMAEQSVMLQIMWKKTITKLKLSVYIIHCHVFH